MHSQLKKTGVHKSKSVLQLFPFFHQKNEGPLKKDHQPTLQKKNPLKINLLNLKQTDLIRSLTICANCSSIRYAKQIANDTQIKI
jgi:hypothetical protein